MITSTPDHNENKKSATIYNTYYFMKVKDIINIISTHEQLSIS